MTLFISGIWLYLQGFIIPLLFQIAAIIAVLFLCNLSAVSMNFFYFIFPLHLFFFLCKHGAWLSYRVFIRNISTYCKFILCYSNPYQTPPSHAAVMLRYYFLENLSSLLFSEYPPHVQNEIRLTLGVRFAIGEMLLPLWTSGAFLAEVVLCFLSVYLSLF